MTDGRRIDEALGDIVRRFIEEASASRGAEPPRAEARTRPGEPAQPAAEPPPRAPEVETRADGTHTPRGTLRTPAVRRAPIDVDEGPAEWRPRVTRPIPGPPAPRPRFQTRLALSLLAAALLLKAAVPPTLSVRNELIRDVMVKVGGEKAVLLRPGEALRRRVQLVPDIVWQMQVPLGSAGASARVLEGQFRSPATPLLLQRFLFSSFERVIDARVGGQAFFAPLITNRSRSRLRVLVNEGLQSEALCTCVIPPGSVNVFVGYYPLFANSSVRLSATSGGSVVRRGFSAALKNRGAVAIEVRNGDFR